MEGRKIVIAITGASGAVYAKVLLDKVARLKNQVAETAVLMSDNAKTVWEYELSGASWKDYPFKFYEGNDFRSEEHTSELQSLMRISYAVFCLKNKTKHKMKEASVIQHTHTN